MKSFFCRVRCKDDKIRYFFQEASDKNDCRKLLRLDSRIKRILAIKLWK